MKNFVSVKQRGELSRIRQVNSAADNVLSRRTMLYLKFLDEGFTNEEAAQKIEEVYKS